MSDVIVVRAITDDRETGTRQVDFEVNGEPASVTFDSDRRLAEVESPTPLHSQAEAARLILSWWLSVDPSGSDTSLIVGKRLQVDLSNRLDPLVQLDP